MALRAVAVSFGRTAVAGRRVVPFAAAPLRRGLSMVTKPVRQGIAALADVNQDNYHTDAPVPPAQLPHARGDLTPAIRGFFDATDHDFPVLAVDISVVEWGYRALASALPKTDIYYAVKANPAGEILDR